MQVPAPLPDRERAEPEGDLPEQRRKPPHTVRPLANSSPSECQMRENSSAYCRVSRNATASRGRAKSTLKSCFTRPGPGRHQDDAVGKGQRLAEIVGHEQHGLARVLPEIEQHRMHVELGVGIERAERLVHQQDFRLRDQGTHQRHALPHAARQRRRIEAAKAVEAGLVDRFLDPRAAFGSRDARELQRVADIALDRAPRKQRVLLEHVADMGDRPAGNHGFAVDADVAAVGRDQGRHHVEDGALAAARGAEQGDELAVIDPERGIVDRHHLAALGEEALAETGDFDAAAASHVSEPRQAGGYLACAALRNWSATASSSLIGCLMPVSSLYQTFSPRA